MFNGIEVLDATPCTTLPSAPTGLTATATYPSVIGLSWTAVTPPANCTISSYSVYGGTTANPTTLIASGLTGTTYSNTGLTASTTYYYVVKAVDAEGTSAASAQATATTPASTRNRSSNQSDGGGLFVPTDRSALGCEHSPRSKHRPGKLFGLSEHNYSLHAVVCQSDGNHGRDHQLRGQQLSRHA